MATKKTTQSAEEVVRKEFPQFDIVHTPKPDARFLPADAKTPGVKQLHRKYNSDSAVEAVVENAEPASSEDATQAVVIEPKIKHDGHTKRLTVLVKQGKVRAVQG